MMVTLQHATTPLAAGFIRELGCGIEDSWRILIREHTRYDPESIVDAELRVANRLVVAIESKIYRRQLDDTEQSERYFRLLSGMKEKCRVLLLISPDGQAPPAANVPGQTNTCFVRWLAWVDVHKWFKNRLKSIPEEAVLDRYLVGELGAYLEHLGLAGSRRGTMRRVGAYEPRLGAVLANATTERILMHIAHYGSAYGRQVSRDHGVHILAVQRQLRRLERCGILRSRKIGKTVVYTLDERYPYLRQLMDLIRAAYEAMSPAERMAAFGE